jgi:hypothetical protein
MGLAVACREQLSGCILDGRAGSVQVVGALLLLLAVVCRRFRCASSSKSRRSMVQPGSAVRVRLAIGVVAIALLVCAGALAQTPTPDPAPLPPPPPATSEPPPPPAEVPSTSTDHHPRARRHHATERRLLQPELGPFHPSTAEAGPTVLAPQAGLVNSRHALSTSSADSGSIARTDDPRPVVIALAIVLVLTAGVLLLVFLQY